MPEMSGAMSSSRDGGDETADGLSELGRFASSTRYRGTRSGRYSASGPKRRRPSRPDDRVRAQAHVPGHRVDEDETSEALPGATAK